MNERLITGVEPGSIAAELGIRGGDFLLAVNGREPGDILDWQLVQADTNILLAVKKQSGEVVEYEIEKDYDEAIGLVFASPTLDKIRTCRNKCLFCFIAQMPRGMRETLYVKDDDYRLSFLTGSYITLTNLREGELERICRLHLSPLYVSVHTTDPVLRCRMLGNKRAAEILTILKKLAASGIIMHTQAVLCPGINDGAVLDRTISELLDLYPAVQTLAVVPVGLTGHRSSLHPLNGASPQDARRILEQVESWQKKALAEHGTRFVFAADEFYSIAKEKIPPAAEYEGYPQLENGVGLVRLLLDEWEELQSSLPPALPQPVQAAAATGESAALYLRPVIERLNRIKNLKIKLVPVKNRFFGGHVTVAGLLTFHDLARELKGVAGTVYLPKVMLKEGKEMFLDGYTVNDLARALQTKVKHVSNLKELIDDLLAQ
ncbi:MAG: DUF512 domain-containing protein [Bacillota bacterium]|nr:DUF512 domain-containing protein [Bacillota bacterium]HHU30647.1 DUF512 domain-containing protein [Bacillota bacterium]